MVRSVLEFARQRFDSSRQSAAAAFAPGQKRLFAQRVIERSAVADLKQLEHFVKHRRGFVLRRYDESYEQGDPFGATRRESCGIIKAGTHRAMATANSMVDRPMPVSMTYTSGPIDRDCR
jgi:hypothetical protein